MGPNRVLRTSLGTHTEAFGPTEWALTLTAGCIWGASFLFIVIGLDAFAPAVITWLRIAFGFVAIACIPASHKKIERQDWPGIVFLSITWMAFPLALFPIAERHVSSAVTGMLNGATPLFVALVASIMLRRAPHRRQATGLLVGIVGVVLIGLPTISKGSNSLTGVGLILTALLSYGVAINVAVPLQHKYGSLPVLWRTQIVALALTTPFAIAGLGHSTFAWGPFLACMALGVFGTGVAYALAATLAGRVGGTRASLTTYIIPVVSIVLGRVFRGEHIAALAAGGTVVVLAGAWLASRAEV